MALSRDNKAAVIDDLVALLTDAKMTVLAQYTGLGVKDLQSLRAQARDNATAIRVAKNRLVVKALGQVDSLKEADTALLKGQLMYAFGSEDEVAPAQVLANFAKDHAQLQLIGAIAADGSVLNADEIKRLADLPTKDQLRAQLIGTIAAPLTSFVTVVSGNLRGLATVLKARAEQLEA